jgi:hypothetical protein
MARNRSAIIIIHVVMIFRINRCKNRSTVNKLLFFLLLFLFFLFLFVLFFVLFVLFFIA